MAKRLRKAMIAASTLAGADASFINETSDILNIRKTDHFPIVDATAWVLGDCAESHLADIPRTAGHITNNDRSHLSSVVVGVGGGTGSIRPTYITNKVLSFENGQFPLEQDEAIYMNNADRAGAADVTFAANIWYDS